MISTLISVGLIGGLAWYFFMTRWMLNRDPDQHHLASLLIAAASGQGDPAEPRRFLDARSRSPHDRSVRINHAVRLARTAADETLYQRVVALAQAIHRS